MYVLKRIGCLIFLFGLQQVRLDHNGKFSNADSHGIHSENGPVLSEEPGKKYVFFNSLI